MNGKKICAIIIAGVFLQESVLQHALLAAQQLLLSAPSPVRGSIRTVAEAIPARWGTVVDRYDGSSGRLVVHILDLHANPLAQKSIAHIIRNLHATLSVDRILVEGAPAGIVDLGTLRAIPAPMQAGVYDFLLAKGLMNGAEYVCLRDGINPLGGLENWEEYQKACQEYRALQDACAYYASTVSAMDRVWFTRVRRYGSSRLARFESMRERVTDSHKLLDRLVALSRSCNIPLTPYPTIVRVQEARNMQRHLNIRRIQAQLPRYLHILQKDLPAGAYRDLVGASDGVSYSRLAAFAVADSQRREALFPDLARYFSYLVFSESINPITLLDEQDALTVSIETAIAVTPIDQQLAATGSYLRLLRDALNAKLTPRSRDSYVAGAIANWPLVTASAWTPDNGMIESFIESKAIESYYDTVAGRNETFAHTIISAVSSGPDMNTAVRGLPQVTVVVTGGFHRDIAQSLRTAGVSYVTVVPATASPGNDTLYQHIMAGHLEASDISASALMPVLLDIGVAQGDVTSLVTVCAGMVAEKRKQGPVTPEILSACINEWGKNITAAGLINNKQKISARVENGACVVSGGWENIRIHLDTVGAISGYESVESALIIRGAGAGEPSSVQIKHQRFPDGEMNIRIMDPDAIKGKPVTLSHAVRTVDDFMETVFILANLRRYGASHVRLEVQGIFPRNGLDVVLSLLCNEIYEHGALVAVEKSYVITHEKKIKKPRKTDLVLFQHKRLKQNAIDTAMDLRNHGYRNVPAEKIEFSKPSDDISNWEMASTEKHRGQDITFIHSTENNLDIVELLLMLGQMAKNNATLAGETDIKNRPSIHLMNIFEGYSRADKEFVRGVGINAWTLLNIIDQLTDSHATFNVHYGSESGRLFIQEGTVRGLRGLDPVHAKDLQEPVPRGTIELFNYNAFPNLAEKLFDTMAVQIGVDKNILSGKTTDSAGAQRMRDLLLSHLREHNVIAMGPDKGSEKYVKEAAVIGLRKYAREVYGISEDDVEKYIFSGSMEKVRTASDQVTIGAARIIDAHDRLVKEEVIKNAWIFVLDDETATGATILSVVWALVNTLGATWGRVFGGVVHGKFSRGWVPFQTGISLDQLRANPQLRPEPQNALENRLAPAFMVTTLSTAIPKDVPSKNIVSLGKIIRYAAERIQGLQNKDIDGLIPDAVEYGSALILSGMTDGSWGISINHGAWPFGIPLLFFGVAIMVFFGVYLSIERSGILPFWHLQSPNPIEPGGYKQDFHPPAFPNSIETFADVLAAA